MLPFTTNSYNLGENFLAYADSEKDLGVDITSNFTFNQHNTRIISTANQKYGLLRRTFHFVKDFKRRIILYLQEPTGIPAGRESRHRDHDFSPGPGPGQFVSLAGILAGIFSKK